MLQKFKKNTVDVSGIVLTRSDGDGRGVFKHETRNKMISAWV